VQTRTGPDGKVFARTRLTVTQVTADGAAAHAATMFAPRTKALILHPEEFPTFYQAAKRLAAGEATPADCVVTLVAAQGRQQHDRALAVADTLLALRPELRGLHWLRAWVQANGADQEAYRVWAEQEAEAIAATPDDDDLWLANQLLGYAYIRGLEANERLDLLDLLAPVYRRQPDWLQGEQTVLRQRISFLQQASRNVEALELRRQLAQMRPDDLSAQLDYARNVAQVSNWDRGLSMMRQLLGIETWTEAQKIQIANAIASLLQQRRRHEDTAEFIAGFLGDARYPEEYSGSQLWQTWLETLIRLDREAEAHALCRGLLDAAVDPDVPDQARNLALQVAQPIITRQRLYDLFRDTRHRVLETWFEPIAQTIRKAVENDVGLRQLTGFVIQEFNTSDQWKALRTVLLEQVRNRGGSMSAQALQSTVELLRSATPPLEPEEWSRVADVLIARWTGLDRVGERQPIEYLVEDACRRAGQIEPWLQALRAAAETAEPDEQDRLLGQYFTLRVSREWSAESETDAFQLLNRLGEALEEDSRRTYRVMALLDIADWIHRAQLRDEFASIPPPHKSSRTETRRLRSEALKRAAATTAERLAARLSDVPAELHLWLHLGRLQFRCRAGESTNELAGDCVELLGPSAPRLTDLESAADFAFLLRSLRTLEFLATREDADARWAEQTLAYLRAAVTSEPDAELWRDHLVQMLVALDRVPELERSLNEWTTGEQDEPAWRIALAWIAAEQGRLQEAVDHVAPLMALHYLDAATAHGLADWYRALGDEEKHDRTKLYAYEQARPYVVEQMLNRLLQHILQNQESATEIPAEAFLMIRSLAKRGRPPYQLRSYYEHTRDSRLLTCLADCCMNQTARGIYTVLGLMRDLLNKVHDEASVDAVSYRVTTLREQAMTAVDRRALDLIEAAAQTRAARLGNRPDPHVRTARAAMKRAFDREWATGEPRLMADYLQQLGKLEAEALAEEQVRELYALMARESAPGSDRWHTAYSLAYTLGLYARTDEQLAVLESVLAELRNAHGGWLPNQGNSLFNLYIDVLRDSQQFRRAEMTIREELVRPFSSEQEARLLDWLANMYIAAVQAGGDCRLGTGVELYRAVRAELDSILVSPLDVQPLKTMVDHACRLFRVAKSKFPNAGVPDDAVRFGENIMPQVLTRLAVEPYTYSNAIDNVSRMLFEVSGPRPALAFLVECFEAHAKREDEGGREQFWSNCADELGRCLQALDFKPGELEERLVAILLSHLRASLRYGQRSLYVLSKRSGYFWEAKADVFEQTARNVAAENPGRPEVLHQVGRYLHEDLKRTSAAVDVLLPAWKEDRLDENGAFLLAQCLHVLERFEESIPVLNRLIEEAPDTVVYRTTLMWARFKMDQRDLLKGCFQAAEQHFREGHLWAESNASALAEACLRTELYDDAARLYQELIPRRQRDHPRGGAGDYTLSNYHTNLASAYAGLGKTAEAVDAACGAVVVWGNDQGHRQGALSTLVNILRHAEDLKQYAADFSAELAARGVENPVVRRALGVAFLQRKDFDDAIRHLEAAAAAQPNDPRCWEQLVQAYDRNGDRSGAVDALARAVQYMPRELDLYRKLADHLALSEETFQARRAYLSMIEAMPTETEGHTKLAEIRQQQNRWGDAIFHWRRVADLRPLEPTGLLRLAEAQIRARKLDDARDTVRKLEQTAWPDRFRNIETSCTNLRKRIEQADQ
jgi:predicted Zn-dependent protease